MTSELEDDPARDPTSQPADPGTNWEDTTELDDEIISTAADTPSVAPDLPPGPWSFVVDPAEAGSRLDQFLAKHLPHISRVHLRRVITGEGVTVDGNHAKPAYRLHAGQQVFCNPPQAPAAGPLPENIPLDVLYQDAYMIVINKPAGMVVHPAKGNWAGTLASALAYHFGPLSQQGGPTRPGIVHRLDRETSGVILVAKDDQSHGQLARQFADRTIKKEYLAVVAGEPDRDRDEINLPIGPHPYQREKMAIRRHDVNSREACTFYEVQERFRGYAMLNVFPRTGRTHQIRVHLAAQRLPVLCDRLYGGRSQLLFGELSGNLADDRVLLTRQALHARRISLLHPQTHEPLQFEAPLPADILQVLSALRSRPAAK